MEKASELFVKKLKEYRIKKEMSPEGMAQKLGISVETLHDIENGVKKLVAEEIQRMSIIVFPFVDDWREESQHNNDF